MTAGDVTHCDRALVAQARTLSADRSQPRALRAMAWAIGLVFRARAWSGVSKRGRSVLAFRAWGRWCGPGYGAGDPVDALDCACEAHDRCYVAAAGPRPVIGAVRRFLLAHGWRSE